MHFERHRYQQDCDNNCTQVGIDAEDDGESACNEEEPRYEVGKFWCWNLFEGGLARHGLCLGEVIEAARDEHQREQYARDKHYYIH